MNEYNNSIKDIAFPKVSVALTTYNGSKCLREQLDSIYSQSYTNIEVIVIDDCSNDNTIEILDFYKTKYNLQYFINSSNLGVIDNFLKAIALCDGDLIALADQDDFWLQDKIENAVNIISQEDLNTPLVYASRLEFVDENLKHLGYSYIPKSLSFDKALVQNFLSGCTMVFNKKAKDIIISYLPKKILMHDWWIYIVISAFGKIIFDNNITIKYRQHSNNVTGGTSNYLEILRRKIVRFNPSNKAFRVSDQAQIFFEAYYNLLPDAQRKILSEFLGSKKSIFKRIKLILNSKFKRQPFLDDVIFRFLILINKY